MATGRNARDNITAMVMQAELRVAQ